jgi:hypothetical protein
MIFGGIFDQCTERYTSKSEALEGHSLYADEVKASLEMEAMIPTSLRILATLSTGSDFDLWAKDHLAGEFRLFQLKNYIGFRRKSDAATFQLSPWHRLMDD